jgi:hypothetical protein
MMPVRISRLRVSYGPEHGTIKFREQQGIGIILRRYNYDTEYYGIYTELYKN